MEGQCFLCLEKVNTVKEDWDTCKCSLQCLSRYLRMDMEEVIYQIGIGQVSSCSIERSKSKLRVSLCDGCAQINVEFSELFRQLEMIRMEMASYLNIIQSRLQKVNREEKETVGEESSEESARRREKREVFEALRKKTREKCLRKVTKLLPRVAVQKLTEKELDEVKRNFCIGRPSSSKSELVLQQSETKSVSPRVDDGDAAKTTKIPKVETSYSDPDNDSLEDYQVGEGEESEEDEELSQSENAPANAPSHDDSTVKMETEPSPTDDEVEEDEEESKEEQDEWKPSSALLPPTKKVKPTSTSTSTGTKKRGVTISPAYTRDKTTGQFKCKHCDKIFPYQKAAYFHYRTDHLGLAKYRYPPKKYQHKSHQCELCGRKFARVDSFKYHYQSVHLGQGFKCPECGRMFGKKQNMEMHRDAMTCGKWRGLRKTNRKAKVKCHLCGVEFRDSKVYLAHHKAEHLQKKVMCDGCGKEFTRKSDMNKHQKVSCSLGRERGSPVQSAGISIAQ